MVTLSLEENIILLMLLFHRWASNLTGHSVIGDRRSFGDKQRLNLISLLLVPSEKFLHKSLSNS